ncbi:MAG: PQQ-binding-like beta-propeller repeat protein [Phycisphaerales bacterium]|nr:MAG: PQQ-binding-like beta-propeller repeat protein [Phycisphaerales bacterium]
MTTPGGLNRRRHPTAAWLGIITITALWLTPGIVSAQPDNPVFVDQSPRAWELLRRARDQAANNPDEAVRLYQELLDDYPLKLVPTGDSEGDRFVTVRGPVLADLKADASLLRRYRAVQTAEAERLLEAGNLPRLATCRSLTDAGLEALLRLAQQDLESARFHSADHWLREALEHPNLASDRAAYAWFMAGLTAHCLQNDQAVRAASNALSELGDAGLRLGTQLDRYRENTFTDRSDHGISPVQPGEAIELGEPVGQAIWSVELTDALHYRRFARPAGVSFSPRFDLEPGPDELLTAAPTVAGSLAFVNQGHTVLAVDRSTGAEIWRHVERPPDSAIDNDTELMMDLNYVAVSVRSLVTLTGHAYGTMRSSEGHVRCLDTVSGEVRWTANLDRIGAIDDHEGLFPHGAPVIAEGVVCVLARKVTEQHLSSCYVVAMNLNDGSLRWSQHIASVGGARARTYRRFSMLAIDGGDLYVATPLGAVARLDGSSGRIRWLQRYRVPLNPEVPVRAPGPWASPAPIVTASRVLALRPDGLRIVVLDKETGRQIESHPCLLREGWASPQYLLADDQFVFAVGDEIRAFRLDDLTQPVWRLPDPDQPPGDSLQAEFGDFEIIGRLQPTQNDLVVPTDNGILLVEKASGRIRHHIDRPAAGNPLAIEAQIIVAGADRLEAYMAFDRASAMLRRRLNESPHDPDAALALMELAMAGGDLPLAMEAARAAVGTIGTLNNSPEANDLQATLFSLLLRMARDRMPRTEAQAEELHELIGSIAVNDEQRLQHLLTRADWHAPSDPPTAARQYQQILSDPPLTSVWHLEDGRLKTGAAWAAQRIVDLIQTHGPSVHEQQARRASKVLETVMTETLADLDALREISEQYVCTEAAADAALLVAAAYAEQGDHRSALAALGPLISLAPNRDAATTGRLLGACLGICQRFNLNDQALILLQHAVSAYGDPLLVSGRRRVRASSLLRELQESRLSPRLPQIGEQSGPGELIGSILAPRHPHAHAASPPDRALLASGGSVHLVTSGDLTPRWSNYVGSEAPQILRFTDRDVLLWLDDDPEDPRAVMLDAADGAQRWTTPRLSDHLDDPVGDLARLRGVWEQMPGGDPFNPDQIIPRVNDDLLLLIRRTGSAIAFDLQEGSAPLWARTQILSQVYWTGLQDRTLVLAGRTRGTGPGDELSTISPILVVLDAITGEIVHRVRPRGDSDVLWMCFGPLGSLIFATDQGIEVLDLNSGRMRWMNVQPGAPNTLRAWAIGDVVFFQDAALQIRRFDGRQCLISEPLPIPAHGRWDPLELRNLQVVRGRVHARYAQRVVSYDEGGSIAGSDYVTDTRDYRWLLPAEDRLLLISRNRTEQVEMPGDSGRRTLRTYRIYALAHDGRLLSDAVELEPLPLRLLDAVLIDDWLLLSTASETLALPMPRSP